MALPCWFSGTPCRRSLAWCVPTLVVALLVRVAPAMGGSIFDDDWVPPPRQAPAPAAPAAPATRPDVGTSPTPVIPRLPVTPPPSGSLSAAPPGFPPREPATPARRPVPATAEQAKSRALMKEVFSKELEDRAPAAREALARKLLDEAARAADVPADEFVVFGGAVRSAVEAGDLPLALDAAGRMGEVFDLDALALKASAAAKMPAKGYAVDSDRNVPAALELLGPLEAAEDFTTASRLVAILQQVPGGAPSLRATLTRRAKEIEDLRAARDRLGPALEKLKVSPDDPAANLAVGRYKALLRGDWDEGLPMLAKGSDAKLQSLARRDVAKPADPAAQAALADDWWAAAGREQPAAGDAMRRRAATWYGRALPGLSGLTKIATEKRVAEVDAAGAAGPADAGAAPGAGRAAGGLTLTPVAAFDGRFETVEEGGVKLVRGKADDHGNYDPHIYFTAGDHAREVHDPVFLWLTYRDLGRGNLVVEYNGDGKDYQRAQVVSGGKLTGDGRTRTAVFKLDAPDFRHKENGGADMRVLGAGGKMPLCIERAALYPQPPPP